MQTRRILLTNDDGIRSPGLLAAAEALSQLGEVIVSAPGVQSSGMGRSLPGTSSGIIEQGSMLIAGKERTVYAVSGSPAQSVLHGVLEIMSSRPDLVVSGINYGENVATGITISGTVGAAMEAASLGIPALAMSLETDREHHLSYSTAVDFSCAAHFTAYFAGLLLEKRLPADVDLLKVDVPSNATPETSWLLTRISRQRYYEPVPTPRSSWLEPAKMDYRENGLLSCEPWSDVYILRVKRLVSVTPISLDMTSRADFADLERLLRP